MVPCHFHGHSTKDVGQTLVYEWRIHSALSSRNSRDTWQRTEWKMLIMQPITRLRMALPHGALFVWETLLTFGAEPPSMSLLHLEVMPGSWLFPWQGFGWRAGKVGQIVHHLSCSELWGSLVSNLVFVSAFLLWNLMLHFQFPHRFPPGLFKALLFITFK